MNKQEILSIRLSSCGLILLSNHDTIGNDNNDLYNKLSVWLDAYEEKRWIAPPFSLKLWLSYKPPLLKGWKNYMLSIILSESNDVR